MELIQLIVLSLIQGITEFLPVSSSAHLILVPLLTGWQDQGLTTDIAAHLGSLIAVIFYFRKDINGILTAGLHSIVKKNMDTTESRLFWYLAIASTPILIAGFFLHDIVSTYLRDPLIIAAASIGFGLLLWFSDAKGKRIRQIKDLNWRDALIIGLAQTLALIPGTSRSGITITAGLLAGLDCNSAVRFSFLMAVPTIMASAAYESLKLFQLGITLATINFFVTVVFSTISTFLTIHYFLKFLNKVGMLPFIFYRIALGVVLVVLFI